MRVPDVLSVVHFSRGTLPKNRGKRALLGDLVYLSRATILFEKASHMNRDPYILHLNIATCKWWFPTLLWCGKSHVSNGCKMYFVRSPDEQLRNIDPLESSKAGLSRQLCVVFPIPKLNAGILARSSDLPHGCGS